MLNVWLAEELRSRGLDARAESPQPGGRTIDVEVKIGPVVVAVEAEHGQSTSKRNEAIGDADARLEQEIAQCAVAVCYPDDSTRDSLRTADDLIWTVRDGFAEQASWHDGDLDHLSSAIRLLPAQLGDPDAVAVNAIAELGRSGWTIARGPEAKSCTEIGLAERQKIEGTTLGQSRKTGVVGDRNCCHVSLSLGRTSQIHETDARQPQKSEHSVRRRMAT